MNKYKFINTNLNTNLHELLKIYNKNPWLLNIELEKYIKTNYDNQTTVSIIIFITRRAKTIFKNSSEVADKRVFLN